METLVALRCFDRASAFRSSWNKMEESHSYHRAYLKRVCRLRFSFFVNDFGSALARRTAFLMECWRSARARHEPRRPVGLARLCLEVTSLLLAERGL